MLRQSAVRVARALAAAVGGGYVGFCEAEEKDWPVFSRSEVRARSGKGGGDTWVTYERGVYDITEFINAHPGGAQKIRLAAGGSVEPFWRVYRQHFNEDAGVAKLLETLRIGTLAEADYAAETTAAAARADDDPYRDEPERHPALVVHGAEPMNAESPPALLGDPYVTPAELWYVRNHHPVPRLGGDDHALALRLGSTRATVTVADLKADYEPVRVTATMQCSGNRRGHMNAFGKTSGTPWGPGAASTATWTGAPLRDVVARELGLACDRPVGDASSLGLRHAVFEAADGMSASIPLEKALGDLGDVLLAYEMNGAPIPRDHGGPLRVVVPGYAGVRNVKWLSAVTLSPHEAEGAWQRGMNYKAMPAHWRTKDDLKGVDFAALPSIHELPTQCAFAAPCAGDTLAADADTYEARGWALGSAGRAIHRVEVSADGGATWRAADLDEGADQPYGRAWAWTTWSVDLDVAPGRAPVALLARAFDLGGGAQPATPAAVWNIRGLNNNSYHAVTLDRTPARD